MALSLRVFAVLVCCRIARRTLDYCHKNRSMWHKVWRARMATRNVFNRAQHAFPSFCVSQQTAAHHSASSGERKRQGAAPTIPQPARERLALAAVDLALTTLLLNSVCLHWVSRRFDKIYLPVASAVCAPAGSGRIRGLLLYARAERWVRRTLPAGLPIGGKTPDDMAERRPLVSVPCLWASNEFDGEQYNVTSIERHMTCARSFMACERS